MTNTNKAQLTAADTARTFILAGNARVTFVSMKTGARFTFRVTEAKRNEGDDRAPVHFVALLDGADNDNDFSFLGTIFADGNFRHGRKSRIGEDAPSARAFAWVWSKLSGGHLPTTCEIWHEGRCGRCGRSLTVPESIETGLGPVCSAKA